MFDCIASLENLFIAWREFRRGKKARLDIQQFELNLEDQLFLLHEDLIRRSYIHNTYTPFYITDPKLRHIHKATVRDRVVHHAVFRVLEPIFDKTFIHDSYSCRTGKGSHRAVCRLEQFLRPASQNNHQNVYALKCDIRKFFDSIDQRVLFDIIGATIKDKATQELVQVILKSFSRTPGIGLPLGNVTSQLFANIYMNEFDQFVKHNLKIKQYLRYCDDFIVLGHNPEELMRMAVTMDEFLKNHLRLSLHPNKIIIRKWSQGIDFLGYVVLPFHRVLRTRTKRRILRKVRVGITNQSLQSYLGILKHCSGNNIRKSIYLDNHV